MDTQVEKCIKKVEEFEGICFNEMDTQVERCIQKVEEFEGILRNDLGTPVKFTTEVSDVLYKSIHATSTSSTTITTKQPTTNI